MPTRPATNYNRGGGTHTHKDPNCACLPCTARRRKEEALALSGGSSDGTAEESKVGVLKAPQVNGSPRVWVAQWLELKAKNPSLTTKAIAEELGIGYKYLAECVRKARKDGWLELEDPMERIEYEIIPKVVENVVNFLDAKSEKVTIEAMKGLIFPIYKDSIGVHEAPKTILAIKIDTAPTQIANSTASGQILGKPRQFIDAESVTEVKDGN